MFLKCRMGEVEDGKSKWFYEASDQLYKIQKDKGFWIIREQVAFSGRWNLMIVLWY